MLQINIKPTTPEVYRMCDSPLRDGPVVSAVFRTVHKT